MQNGIQGKYSGVHVMVHGNTSCGPLVTRHIRKELKSSDVGKRKEGKPV